MRLYTDNKGAWAGTQSDAKSDFGTDYALAEVPTDKPTLLEFLNEYQVGHADAISAQMDMVETVVADGRIVQATPHPQSCSANDLSTYDVRDVVLNCDKKHLGSALGSIVTRLHDMQEYV
tara:strand:- start:280 stop:639 length:360 start_codon:yes stop_codon:yes gene_type:complete